MKGWEKKQAKLMAVARKQTQILAAVAGCKEDISKYWPIEVLDGDRTKPLTRLQFKKIMNNARKKEIERRLLNGNSKT